ncbi:MAG: hypothetical protein EBZ81_13985 [Betaproteobacteria bacterium]|nr:hypothetical protein [Betaproteobacteria bacterium]
MPGGYRTDFHQSADHANPGTDCFAFAADKALRWHFARDGLSQDTLGEFIGERSHPGCFAEQLFKRALGLRHVKSRFETSVYRAFRSLAVCASLL